MLFPAATRHAGSVAPTAAGHRHPPPAAAADDVAKVRLFSEKLAFAHRFSHAAPRFVPAAAVAGRRKADFFNTRSPLARGLAEPPQAPAQPPKLHPTGPAARRLPAALGAMKRQQPRNQPLAHRHLRRNPWDVAENPWDGNRNPWDVAQNPWDGSAAARPVSALRPHPAPADRPPAKVRTPLKTRKTIVAIFRRFNGLTNSAQNGRRRAGDRKNTGTSFSVSKIFLTFVASNLHIMAIAIASIPVLTGKAAEDFETQAEENYRQYVKRARRPQATASTYEQGVEMVRAILAKSQLKKP